MATPYSIHTLTNGLRIVLAPMRGTPTASVIIMSGTGSRYESESENGLAHFLEHMFFKGTKKRPTARMISEELDGIGSQYNAFTSKDRTAYWAKVSGKYIDDAIDVVTDLYLNSSLPAKEIEKERGAIIQEIDMYEDMPMRTIDNVFDALIFDTVHPLGRTILGPKENIRRFTRQEFAAYRARNYGPGNTVVCVAGAFDEKKVLAKLRTLFKELPKTPSPTPLPIDLTGVTTRVGVKQKKTDQTQLMIGVPAYPYLHKDEYAATVLAGILGSGMSSRLFTEVREKRGLCYAISAGHQSLEDTGIFSIGMGLDHGRVDEALKTVWTELKKISTKPVSADELRRAKDHVRGRLTLALEDSSAYADWYGRQWLFQKKQESPEQRLKRIEAVTPADIKKLAATMFRKEHMAAAAIGPLGKKSHVERLFGF